MTFYSTNHPEDFIEFQNELHCIWCDIRVPVEEVAIHLVGEDHMGTKYQGIKNKNIYDYIFLTGDFSNI